MIVIVDFSSLNCLATVKKRKQASPLPKEGERGRTKIRGKKERKNVRLEKKTSTN